MGVMFKLFKNKQITMDLRTMKRKRRMLTLDGNIVLMDVQEVNTDTTKTEMQTDFTTDHVLQLCKYLAEKSKKIKILDDKYSQQLENTVNNQQHIVDENLLYENATTTTSTSTKKMELKNSVTTNQADNKRDILLKIRHHIYERKRQRHLAQLLVKERLSVWRPW